MEIGRRGVTGQRARPPAWAVGDLASARARILHHPMVACHALDRVSRSMVPVLVLCVVSSPTLDGGKDKSKRVSRSLPFRNQPCC